MDAAEVPSFGSFQLPDAVQEDREERSRDAGRKASRSSKHMSAFESSSSRPQGGEETQSSANWKDQKLKSGHERHNRSSHSSKRRRRHDSENESDADRSARKLRSARNRDERRASRSLRQLETESRSVRRPESSEEYIARVSSVHTASHVKRSVSNEVNLQHLEDSYFVDAKGDHKAATCGGLSASKLPRYQRFGDGCVLGLSRSLRISFSSARLDGKVLEILPKGGRRVRYLDKEERWRARQPAPLRIAPGTSPSSAAFGEYEALSESEVRGGARSASDDDPLPDYRDFHRKRTSASPRRDRREASPQDTSNKVESDSATILRARVSSLDVRVREDASDVEGWLQLAHVQAQLVKALSSSGNQSIRGHHRQHRAGAEASLAVLTRARRSNPRNASLELAYLRKGSLIWENEKCDKEWSALLKSGEMQGQRLGAVWVAYLEWSSRQAGPLSTFLEAVTKGLKALLSATWKAQLFEERQILEQALVTLWTTAVRHLSEAGYYERAFALVQAQLEVTFCAPLGLESQDEESHERLIDSFSQFWDDEGPRIGEEGAKGWANQYGHRDVPDAGASMPSIDPSSLPYRSSKSDDSVPWVERERARAGLRQKPARATATPLHGEDEVDPYAFILSSDVVQLVAVPITAPAVKSRVLDFALGYLGMSPGIAWAGDPAQSSAKFQGETRAGPTAMLALQQRFWPFSLSPTGGTESDVPLIAKTEGEVMGGLRQNNLSQPFDVPITCWAPRLPELYSTSRVELGSQWFTSVRTDDLQHADLETASNVLDHLPPDAGGLSRTIARFAFEHATRGHKAARSLARGELDANRDSMELWHAFAWLEESAGKLDSARLVYRSALDKLRADSRTLAVSEALPMLRDWAEMEWRARQNSFAAKGDLVSPMARGAIMSCRALLEHLVEGGIESYCKVIEHAMEYLKHGEDALERLDLFFGNFVAPLPRIRDTPRHQGGQISWSRCPHEQLGRGCVPHRAS
ncbi:DUF1740-domain-containing protein [Ceraceosorus guamensis]|uniref:DUF1740-domain-containing protein n=1 Tax=Ceraceosorus guamensis TaxID=1522189 RepID=A0A316W6F4_9BASI|nr:DUF1740-domain-containing protein [Ceraceosorus guamensis]PWN43245.1 DUF1740-domain-containing protein [Ceraceosorus guamensis]